MFVRCASAGALALTLVSFVQAAQQQVVSEKVKQVDEEMLIVASRLPTPAMQLGDAVSVLNRGDIERLGYNQLPEVLRHLPGLSVTRTGGFGGLTQVRVRGAEANHVVVLVDGVDISTANTGEVDFSGLLAGDIERIEVVRGPQSGVYGSNAIGGVISITTRTASEGLGGDVALEMGRFDRRSAGLSIYRGGSRISGSASVSYFESDFDVSNDDRSGGEEDSEESLTFNGKLEWRVSDHARIGLTARRTERETETDGFDFSGGPAQGLAVDDDSVSDTTVDAFGLQATIASPSDQWAANFSWQFTATEIDGQFFGSEDERSRISIDSRYRVSDLQAITLFADWEEEAFQNLYPFDTSQAREQTRALFGYGVEYQSQLGDSLFTGLTLRRDEGDDFEDEITYSLDFAYELSEVLRVRGTYGRAVTNPTFFEQFGFVPSSFTGNPDLEPESSTGWDMGLTFTSADERLKLELTYFEAELENEIQSAFPSVINGRGESDRSGVEFGLAMDSGTSFLQMSYTYTDSTDVQDSKQVRQPEHMASLNAGHIWLEGRLKGSLSAYYTDGHYDNDFRNYYVNGFVAGMTKLDARTVINAEVSYGVSERIRVYIRGENLFDEKYQEVISYDTPGATLLFGIKASW